MTRLSISRDGRRDGTRPCDPAFALSRADKVIAGQQATAFGA